MQIQRYEHDAHLYADAQGNRLVSSAGVSLQGTHSKTGLPAEGDANLDPLRTALRQHSELRPGAIERARQNVASGEYLTPTAATKLAGSDLRNEFFPSP